MGSAPPVADLFVVDLFEGRPVSNYWDDLPPEKEVTAVDFRALLEHVRAITVEDLAAEVAQLPHEILVRLSNGPRESRYACAVCDAIGGPGFYRRKPDLTDPRWRVHGWHDVPKLFMTNTNHLHYGPLADETYKRCIAIYRAAGWQGNPFPPIYADDNARRQART